jgi:hypothetical protein
MLVRLQARLSGARNPHSPGEAREFAGEDQGQRYSPTSRKSNASRPLPTPTLAHAMSRRTCAASLATPGSSTPIGRTTRSTRARSVPRLVSGQAHRPPPASQNPDPLPVEGSGPTTPRAVLRRSRTRAPSRDLAGGAMTEPAERVEIIEISDRSLTLSLIPMQACARITCAGDKRSGQWSASAPTTPPSVPGAARSRLGRGALRTAHRRGRPHLGQGGQKLRSLTRPAVCRRAGPGGPPRTPEPGKRRHAVPKEGSRRVDQLGYIRRYRIIEHSIYPRGDQTWVNP